MEVSPCLCLPPASSVPPLTVRSTTIPGPWRRAVCAVCRDRDLRVAETRLVRVWSFKIDIPLTPSQSEENTTRAARVRGVSARVTSASRRRAACYPLLVSALPPQNYPLAAPTNLRVHALPNIELRTYRWPRPPRGGCEATAPRLAGVRGRGGESRGERALATTRHRVREGGRVRPPLLSEVAARSAA